MLGRACERVLFEGARVHRPVTRQQLRAAAREFVRRHRRDPAYLRWVLRSAGASSALASSLLGLSAAPAGAELAPFRAQTGAENPLLSRDVGTYSAPAFADLDGDGDQDLVSGEAFGAFVYFENTGTAVEPGFFFLHTGAGNPLDGQDAGNNSKPVFGDLDADGDLDLISGEADGAFRYFENTGTPIQPAFAARTGSANPLDGQSVGNFFSSPALGDLDR